MAGVLRGWIMDDREFESHAQAVRTYGRVARLYLAGSIILAGKLVGLRRATASRPGREAHETVIWIEIDRRCWHRLTQGRSRLRRMCAAQCVEMAGKQLGY